jgi:hypothetical protein
MSQQSMYNLFGFSSGILESPNTTFISDISIYGIGGIAGTSDLSNDTPSRFDSFTAFPFRPSPGDFASHGILMPERSRFDFEAVSSNGLDTDAFQAFSNSPNPNPWGGSNSNSNSGNGNFVEGEFLLPMSTGSSASQRSTTEDKARKLKR